MSSNKSSAFPAKYKSDNEERQFKQPHKDTFTSKQETLERIKRLHIKCGVFDTEHLFVLTKTWLEYQQYEDVHVAITKYLYNAYCKRKYFFVENDFESWDPKIHGPCNYLQSLLLLRNVVSRIVIHLQCLEMVYQKIQDHLIKSR